jgi:hypothetical protein
MDDFLHNLRSGNLKQPDRNRRQYGDSQYKGPQRRTGSERRKRDDNGETLSAIKDLLKSLYESQKRMTKVLDERNRTEERKARALELIAARLDKISLDKKSNTVQTNLQMPKKDGGKIKKNRADSPPT